MYKINERRHIYSYTSLKGFRRSLLSLTLVVVVVAVLIVVLPSLLSFSNDMNMTSFNRVAGCTSVCAFLDIFSYSVPLTRNLSHGLNQVGPNQTFDLYIYPYY